MFLTVALSFNSNWMINSSSEGERWTAIGGLGMVGFGMAGRVRQGSLDAENRVIRLFIFRFQEGVSWDCSTLERHPRAMGKWQNCAKGGSISQLSSVSKCVNGCCT